jgi:hypothetical protein
VVKTLKTSTAKSLPEEGSLGPSSCILPPSYQTGWAYETHTFMEFDRPGKHHNGKLYPMI